MYIFIRGGSTTPAPPSTSKEIPAHNNTKAGVDVCVNVNSIVRTNSTNGNLSHTTLVIFPLFVVGIFKASYMCK